MPKVPLNPNQTSKVALCIYFIKMKEKCTLNHIEVSCHWSLCLC